MPLKKESGFIKMQNPDIGLICIAASAVLLVVIALIVFFRREMPPFQTVLISGSPAQTLAYIKKGADPNGHDEYGITPLMVAAAYNKNTKVTDILLKAGASVMLKDAEGLTALFHAIKNSAPQKTLDLLLKRGSNLYDRTNNGQTALTIALSNKPAPGLLVWLKNTAWISMNATETV